MVFWAWYEKRKIDVDDTPFLLREASLRSGDCSNDIMMP